MGRPRKPTNVLEMSGAFKKNPARRRARAGEVKVETQLGDPPRKWVEQAAKGSPQNAEMVEIWSEIAASARPYALTGGDRIFFEMLCDLTWRVRHKVASLGERELLRKMLGEIQMTPSARIGRGDNKPPVRAGGEWADLVG